MAWRQRQSPGVGFERSLWVYSALVLLFRHRCKGGERREEGREEDGPSQLQGDGPSQLPGVRAPQCNAFGERINSSRSLPPFLHQEDLDRSPTLASLEAPGSLRGKADQVLAMRQRLSHFKGHRLAGKPAHLATDRCPPFRCTLYDPIAPPPQGSQRGREAMAPGLSATRGAALIEPALHSRQSCAWGRLCTPGRRARSTGVKEFVS